MKEKTFKPQLAPNEKVDLSTLNYFLFASTKLDGIRCIIKNGEILSRSLKQIQNKQLRERLEPLRKFSQDNNLMLDGELFSPKLTFQQITHYVMTQDLENELLPEHLVFYCFDGVKENQFDEPFGMRYINNVNKWCQKFPNLMKEVKQVPVNSAEEVEKYFEEVLEQGYEGLILRNPNSGYKFGRGTIREAIIFKVKPFLELDAIVTGVVQATRVDENAEKKVNELGMSVTSKKKDDRILIEKASAVTVDYNGQSLKVTLALTDEEKIEVWKNRDSYIGRWIEYKYLAVGMKEGGLPRHPTSLRWRMDKD
jgi:DNA ligase-1